MTCRLAVPEIAEVLGRYDRSAGLPLVMRSGGGESLDHVPGAERPRVDEVLRGGIASATMAHQRGSPRWRFQG